MTDVTVVTEPRLSARKDKLIALSLAGVGLIIAVTLVTGLRSHDDRAPLPPADSRVGLCTTTDGTALDCAAEGAAYEIVSTANTADDCHGGAFFTYPDDKSYCAKDIG